MHIRLSDDAVADLVAIEDFLKPRNSEACQRVLASVFTVLDQLENFPLLGHAGTVEGTRELVVGKYPYRIIYTLPDAFHIDVERILSCRQQWPQEV